VFDGIGYKEVMGALAVLIALIAYGIYGWQTTTGQTRPHPLSWLIFGILTGTGFLVQLDEKAGPGSWVMGVTAAICFILAAVSVKKGERSFPWYEWAFLIAAGVVFLFYLWTKEPTSSAVLATAVDVLGYGPTLTKAWSRPATDSVTSFALNSIKFVPSLFAMENISVATCVYPSTLIVVNGAVAILLLWRRAQMVK
jgi:chromate transport protein ChrA